jgi:hypothetical protein
MEEQQHQQQQPLHRGVLEGIAWLADPRYPRQERHKLVVYGYDEPPVDRHSLQHLVDFLNNVDSHTEVARTELKLVHVQLVSDPSGGGLNVLRDFFARSDTRLTEITLKSSSLCSREDVSGLFAAVHANRTVTDMKIDRIESTMGKAFFPLALLFLV